jgi:hypothetical protein
MLTPVHSDVYFGMVGLYQFASFVFILSQNLNKTKSYKTVGIKKSIC